MKQRVWLLLVTSSSIALAWLVRLSPRLSFGLADRMARAAFSFHLFGGAFREMAESYAAFAGTEASRIGASLAASEMKTRVFDEFTRRSDEERVAALVRWENEPSFRAIVESGRGAVFATWHMGPTISALFSVLTAANVAAGMINYTSAAQRPTSVEMLGTADASGQTALSFARALAILRAGRIVVIAVDGKWGTNTAPVTCLGREVSFRRGFAALARMTGSPVYPVGSRWENAARPVVLTIGQPIVPVSQALAEDVERELSAGLARWLEHHLTATPQFLSRGFSRLE